MSLVAPTSGHAATTPWAGPRRRPWYVAGLMVAHFAIGSVVAFIGAVNVVLLIVDLLSRDRQFDPSFVAFALPACALFAFVGVLLFHSGQCIRKRKSRRYSVFCGSLLFFGGPFAVLALLSLWGLTRAAAVAYYESDVESPGFPVVSPGRV